MARTQSIHTMCRNSQFLSLFRLGQSRMNINHNNRKMQHSVIAGYYACGLHDAILHGLMIMQIRTHARSSYIGDLQQQPAKWRVIKKNIETKMATTTTTEHSNILSQN